MQRHMKGLRQLRYQASTFPSQTAWFFTARYAERGIAIRQVVCLSVCPSVTSRYASY